MLQEKLPPTRDMYGWMARVRQIEVPGFHAFSDGNESEAKPPGSLPAPPQWLIERMSEAQLADLIEKHVDFVDEDGESVRLQDHFVRHYLQQDDSPLPKLAAVATMPIVLADGHLLAPDGLDEDRGIAFMIPDEMRAILPKWEDCTDKAVRKAMRFLTDEWLCDVATDYAGKCVIIAAACSLIERSVLPDRPVFFITAGKRGNGKTTTMKMVVMAATGLKAGAAAWSPNEEERRKALLSYFMAGVPYILWDNIPLGSQISCPHIERSCTSAMYADRKLGVSETVQTAATTIHMFTGNNIGPKGDLASRSLSIRLDVNRPDPENRNFRHTDPVQWTADHRAEIIRALYTILLGNPFLEQPRDAACKTRFKLWWRLIGSAIEHAAELDGKRVDFQALFLGQERDDEETNTLAALLTALRKEWPPEKENGKMVATAFTAKDVAELINEGGATGVLVRDNLFERLPAGQTISVKAVGKRLKARVDAPVQVDEGILTLRADDGREGYSYFVTRRKLPD